jgi:hypothetical protein
MNARAAQAKTDRKRERSRLSGRAAELRVARELRAAFEAFVETTDIDEQEFLLGVLEDAAEMRGTKREWLECIQTAFNQNLGDETRLLRVKPEQVPDVLSYLRWLEGREADEREVVQTCG